jgi:hypothetical protein
MVHTLSRPDQILLLETFLEIFDIKFKVDSFDSFSVLSDAIFESYALLSWQVWNEYAELNSLDMYNCKDCITLLKDIEKVALYKRGPRMNNNYSNESLVTKNKGLKII